jgi:hypothetical protein
MKLTTEDIRRELLEKIAEEKARGYQAETILEGIELYLKFRNDET